MKTSDLSVIKTTAIIIVRILNRIVKNYNTNVYNNIIIRIVRLTYDVYSALKKSIINYNYSNVSTSYLKADLHH
jgi:hypothetical protein